MARPDRKALSEASIKASRAVLEELGDQLLSGEISLGQFEDRFKEEMKAEYIRQYLLGIGGLENMTPEDWDLVASDLETQYKFADAYIGELGDAVQEDDEGLTLAGLLWRLPLYAEAGNAIYEAANAIIFGKNGADEEIWNLDDQIPEDRHCDSCRRFSTMGVQPIGTFPNPGDGSTECMGNCHCWKSYLKDGEVIETIGNDF